MEVLNCFKILCVWGGGRAIFIFFTVQFSIENQCLLLMISMFSAGATWQIIYTIRSRWRWIAETG